MTQHKWLLFTARLPTSPSSIRVRVWRRMRAAGAVLLQNGVWVLPQSTRNQQIIHALSEELAQQNGLGCLFTAHPVLSDLEDYLLARFQEERAQEYKEFGEQCLAFLNELRKETAARKFTFAELEENECALHKLTTWLRKIQVRDSFGSTQRDAAMADLRACQEALSTFTAAVYAQLGLGPTCTSDEEQETHHEPDRKERRPGA